jgi:hypothetical protein
MTQSANIGLGIGYAPDNKRVWERLNLGNETYQRRVMFYGVDGMRQGICKVKFATNPAHIRCHPTTESIRTGSNLFSYSASDPVNRNDPTGLAWWEGARDFFVG